MVCTFPFEAKEFELIENFTFKAYLHRVQYCIMPMGFGEQFIKKPTASMKYMTMYK
jgi:hypothetical protein